MKRLDEIFDLRYGQSLELNALEQVQAPAGINFVSRAMGNNGVTARVDWSGDTGLPGEITVALSGNGILSSFVQPEAFVTGFHVMILTPKNAEMSLVEKLWWCRCIWENRPRFSYGRQANRTLGSLLVPDECPEWALSMESPSHEGLSAAANAHVDLTEVPTWPSFPLEQIFEIKKGKRVTKAARQPGTTRFIGATDRNNGITDMCDLEPMFEGGTITVPYNGSVGYAFYQNEPFFASDDVNVLVPREQLSKWCLLFLVTMLRAEKDRFSYGYKWNLDRMRETTMRLPADAEGTPDWDYMERFMKGLPFSAALQENEEVTS